MASFFFERTHLVCQKSHVLGLMNPLVIFFIFQRRLCLKKSTLFLPTSHFVAADHTPCPFKVEIQHRSEIQRPRAPSATAKPISHCYWGPRTRSQWHPLTARETSCTRSRATPLRRQPIPLSPLSQGRGLLSLYRPRSIPSPRRRRRRRRHGVPRAGSPPVQLAPIVALPRRGSVLPLDLPDRRRGIAGGRRGGGAGRPGAASAAGARWRRPRGASSQPGGRARGVRGRPRGADPQGVHRAPGLRGRRRRHPALLLP